MNKVVGIAFALAALSAASVQAQPAQMTGGVLVDKSSGMTLYTFDKDADGKSACTGQCASMWPPATAAGDAKAEGDFTLVSRDDGAKQWAYKGKPVYLYSSDKKPGDKIGDGASGAWHVIK